MSITIPAISGPNTGTKRNRVAIVFFAEIPQDPVLGAVTMSANAIEGTKKGAEPPTSQTARIQ